MTTGVSSPSAGRQVVTRLRRSAASANCASLPFANASRDFKVRFHLAFLRCSGGAPIWQQGAREMTGEADWQEAWREHIWLPYSQMKTAAPPLPVVATEGTRIRLADGRELVDGIASWWTACHGYNHPHIRHAVARQLKAMPHVMFGGLVHEPAVRLATRLAALLPGDLDRVFFSESGSVAVEVALKMAVQFWLNKGVRGRTKFLAFKGAYHGDTFATMAVCDPDEGMHKRFAGVLPQNMIADLPRDAESAAQFSALLQRHAHELAAIIVEPL